MRHMHARNSDRMFTYENAYIAHSLVDWIKQSPKLLITTSFFTPLSSVSEKRTITKNNNRSDNLHRFTLFRFHLILLSQTAMSSSSVHAHQVCANNAQNSGVNIARNCG